MAQDFEQALVAELGSLPGMTGKVFPLDATEGQTPPFIVYLSSYGERVKTLNGYLQTKEIPIEVNILSSTYTGIKPLIPAAIEKLISFVGRVIGTSGPYVQEVSYDSPTELYEEEPKWYRCIITARITI